ncbi:hypothetical protein SNEBB_008506, partial [Seison nebaliae]
VDYYDDGALEKMILPTNAPSLPNKPWKALREMEKSVDDGDIGGGIILRNYSNSTTLRIIYYQRRSLSN